MMPGLTRESYEALLVRATKALASSPSFCPKLKPKPWSPDLRGARLYVMGYGHGCRAEGIERCLTAAGLSFEFEPGVPGRTQDSYLINEKGAA